MENIAPKTLFTGQQLIFLPQCHSTNTYAHDLLNKNKATEGCVVITPEQTQGRGQRGNSWEAEPHKNITLSLILKPVFLAPRQQFYLNMSVALGTLDFAQLYLPSLLKTKWPNDLYYGNKKLGGILIENSVSGHLLQHAIIGIGLNINQLSFATARAISFAQITGKIHDLTSLTERLLECLEARYLQLKQGRLDALKCNYLQYLYRYQEEHPFLVGGEKVSGQIIGIAETGKLCLQIGSTIRFFDFKEVEFVV